MKKLLYTLLGLLLIPTMALAVGSSVGTSSGPGSETVASLGLLPAIGDVDLDGYDLIMDTDGDTALVNDRDSGVSDDEIDVKLATAVDFTFSANTLTAVSGSSISIVDGGLNMGSATADSGPITLIQGGQTGDPQAIIDLTADAEGDFSVTTDTGDVVLTAGKDIYLDPEGLDVIIGDGGDEDYLISWVGDTSTGTLNYDEDNADFEFDQDVTTTGTLGSGDMTITDATPILQYKDSDASAGDVNASLLVACTDTGDGTEDCDVTLMQQVAGAATNFLVSDADGNMTITSAGAFAPSVNDGEALGIVNTNQWSDLFLASGAVVNFDNSDVTLTHSANTLTVEGGDVAMGDNSVTGIDTLTFTDTAGTIAGIQNQNLLDKTAVETISGVYTHSANMFTEAGTGIYVGSTSAVDIGGYDTKFQVIGENNIARAGATIGRWTANNGGAYLRFAKSRDTSPDSYTIVNNNDEVGNIEYYPDDGVDLDTLAAKFFAEVDDASPAAGDIGMAFVWEQMPGGGGALRETHRIAASGVFESQFAHDITIADGGNDVALEVTQNDTTNNPRAASITNTGTGDTLLLDHDGATGNTLTIDSESAGTSEGDVALRVITGQGNAGALFESGANANGQTWLTAHASGSGLPGQNWFFRNLASANTDVPLVYIEQDNSGDDQNALDIQNDGTGTGLYANQVGNGIAAEIDNDGTNHGLYIKQDGVLAASDYGLYVQGTVAQTNSPLAYIRQDHASSTEEALAVVQDGDAYAAEFWANAGSDGGIYVNDGGSGGAGIYVTGSGDQPKIQVQNNSTNHGIFVQNGAVQASGDHALYVVSNQEETNSELVKFRQDNASSSKETLRILNDGTGNAVEINNNNSGKSLFVDHDDTGTGASIDIDRDGNNASAITGLTIDVDNAGAGTGYALTTASGNVGFNTATPSYQLEVNGTLQADDYYSGDGTQGTTDNTSFWMCTAVDCSTTCQVTIKDGLITSCT